MLIIEKIIGDIIVIEDGDRHFDITADKIKGAVKEGDVLILNDDNLYQTDKVKTQKRRADIIKLQAELFD